ncbi:hypothetical protein CVT25_002396 [Psilocybe cyanescens]|uniref:Fungal-type protein kinase domain-containing protein n=1 Tax=Psilocybe cyanescens TaxID=93625 RepID=A0A409WK94_PSICY|nr:hypothetical protein CVT25_002396 [Psilocybe cyanescens]
MYYQVTKTSTVLKKCGGLENTSHQYKHRRFVFEENLTHLEEFKDVKELLTTFSDAIQVHSKAYDHARILHGNINPGNIMIDQHGRGLLIDWDLSKSVTDEVITASLPERTGTWQFIACRLVDSAGNSDPPTPIHNKDDDWESFWHVLFWVALRNCVHGTAASHVQETLIQAYDRSIINARGSSAFGFKFSIITSSAYIIKMNFVSPPLLKMLLQFQAIINTRYILDSEQIDLLVTWKDDALRKRNGAAADDEISPELLGTVSPELMLQMQAHNRKPGREFPVFDPYYFFKSLQPKCAPDLFMELFGPDETVDWVTGSTNFNRDSLLTPAQISLNKPKCRRHQLVAAKFGEAGWQKAAVDRDRVFSVAHRPDNKPTTMVPLFSSGPSPEDVHHVVSAPSFMSTGSPTSRSIPIFNTFCGKIGDFAFLKDTWENAFEEFASGTSDLWYAEGQDGVSGTDPHREAYDKAMVVHRDISANNIMIDKGGRGLLVDWDFSKSIDEKKKERQQPERTLFIAYRLNSYHPPDALILVYNRQDDVESSWHVLFSVALRRSEHLADKRFLVQAVQWYNDNDQAAISEVPNAALVAKIHAMTHVHLIKDQNFLSALRDVLEAPWPFDIYFHLKNRLH